MGDLKTNGYRDLMAQHDFEYSFRFRKTDSNFQDLWRMKATARESLKEWLVAMHTEPQKSEVISNAASELVENCIKYSRPDSFSFVLIKVVQREVLIETINLSTNEQMEGVREYVERINSGKEALAEMYVKKITESVVTGKSQLGFLKILMETEGTIELVKEDEPCAVHLKVTLKV